MCGEIVSSINSSAAAVPGSSKSNSTVPDSVGTASTGSGFSMPASSTSASSSPDPAGTNPLEVNPLAPTERELSAIVEEIEKSCLWDSPSRLFSLVRTKTLLAAPDLPADVEAGLRANWDGSPTHLSAVEQELEPGQDEEKLLATLAWPEQVDGAVVTLERLIVPREVEEAAPTDPDEAAEFVSNHPARLEMRLAVGVLRTGESWCALRLRTFDDDASVAKGADLVPELVDLLKVGFLSETELASRNPNRHG